jgi:PII-like signaling protein
MELHPGKLIRIFVNETDKYRGKPLYEAMVARCQELNLAGVTVFRGLEGFGETAELHRAGLFGGDCPIVITIVETAEKTRLAVPELQSMMTGGIIAVTDVEVAVVSKTPSC